MRASHRRPSPALVVATVALFVALGGTSIAAVNALPRNSVGTIQLKQNAVTSAKVRNGSLLRADFRRGQIPAGPRGAQGPQGPAGPSDAYARFLNGPIAIPAALTTLANLTIPQAGSYVISAKTYITATATGVATCRLEAGADFDQSLTYVPSNLPFALPLLVVHTFAEPGSVDLKCSATGTLQANFLKISAIRVSTLANSG
jgi:hypothetical protein